MQMYYKCCHKDNTVLKNSSSGGVFTAISDYILQQGGIVYGCVMDADLQAIHVRTENTAVRNQMRGSKYVSSQTESIYCQVRTDLQSHRVVLFTGTPCQIAALKSYLNATHTNGEKLLTVEVICHGVGSPRFFKDYIQNLEKTFRGHAVSCNFRAKRYKGQKQDMEVSFDNGKKYHASSTKYDWFYSVYLKNLILRPSCYHCKFASEQRNADISIADLWGKQEEKEARSLVIVNSDLGKQVFEDVCHDLLWEKLAHSEVHQPQMHESCQEPKQREMFWAVYLEHGYLAAQKWIGNNTLKGKWKDRLARAAYGMRIAGAVKKIRRTLMGRY